MANEESSSMQRRARHPFLGRLDALVGEWKLDVLIDGQLVGRGRTTLGWLEDGAFLIQHTDGGPPPPDAPPEWAANSPGLVTTIIGLDDSTGRFYMLYADARDVFRVYQMELGDGAWRVWRDAPGFFQRFTGTFSDDGNSITGRWEVSRDGVTWEHDFDLTYTKVT